MSFACRLCFLAVWAILAVPLSSNAKNAPNILWITAEDMSPTLGCYGDTYATTPNIDRFATESVRYTNAFATAPVCSPSRSCLITGCYATSLGTQQMRSAFSLPDGILGFPTLLREAGYYTSNNFKTDYNTSSATRLNSKSWSESSQTAHWRNRAANATSKPFFSVFNLMTSHQSRSMVWTQDRFRSEVQSNLSQTDFHDPDNAPVPDYYPDTSVTRRIVARYYDCVTVMDAQVGELLRQLEDDGLADDTIVFFYSDHGSGMPRHKRLLHDSGMHVPLLVRFPNKWQHLAPVARGKSTDRLVSFVDFAPTVLALAGIAAPSYMQGSAFLGEGAKPKSSQRDYVFGHRDRIDEVIDLSRSVRDKRFLYVRNYMPHRSWNQYSAYSDLSEIRHELYLVAQRGNGTAPQTHYVGSSKPVEELYDCDVDPANVRNLAGDPKHQAKLRELRDALVRHIEESHDLGFIPESRVWTLVGTSNPWDGLRENPEAELAAWTANSLLELGESHARALLTEKSPSSRYWGAVGLLAFDRLEPESLEALRLALGDSEASVRIESASALARFGSPPQKSQAIQKLVDELNSKSLTVVLHATRSIEMLGTRAASAALAMQRVADRSEKLSAATTQAVFDQSKERDLAMFCAFSANGFLSRLRVGDWASLLNEAERKNWVNVAKGVVLRSDQEHVSMLSKGGNLWIVHNTNYSDFEMTLEAKMPTENYNAGIGFRCELLPNGRPRGYQCEIAEQLSGSLYAIGSGGWVWPKGEEQRADFFDKAGDAFHSGRWNHFRIRCEGPKVKIWVNGILTTDVTDTKHLTGRIALQHHGKGAEHHYRRLHVRPIKVAASANR